MWDTKESVVCLKKEIPKEKKTLTVSHAIALSGDWGKIKKGKDGRTACADSIQNMQ